MTGLERDMLEIYLTRHGETEWNVVRRMQGQGDSPLTELGIKQAKWLAARLENKDIAYVYSSPLKRATDTADIINYVLQASIVIDDRLKEINVGPWQGKEVDEILEEMPKMYNNFWHHPDKFHLEGVEPFEKVQERAAEFIEMILKRHASGRILIVAHAIVLTAMLNYLQGRDVHHFWEGKSILPTSLTKLNASGDRLSVVYMSDTSHFREEMIAGWFIDE